MQPTTKPIVDTGNWFKNAAEYWADTIQRSVLLMNVMRKRGNAYLEHIHQGQPPVLAFDYEVVLDGKTLKHQVNYSLVRILPDENNPVRKGKRPVVIVDPRAGHGPGIGGSKRESEVGMAMAQGHPVYFILFSTEPMPGQTLLDVGQAEVRFLEEVRRLHRDVEEPMVIGNCQAGWATALLAAGRPDVTGPLVINGAPLSYWSGREGGNPMRYRGGLWGGAWLTSLACDLGNGRFDGAHLVAGFEDLNPANTYWTKQYNLYANIDTEEQRYLDFEKWWGGFYLMNAREIHAIVEKLFIGNEPEKGPLTGPGGAAIDLKNLQDPVVVFSSHGDNITPPQQALNWIIKVYGSLEEVKRRGQVLVYLVHQKIGHLGIFVSGSVARKEHAEIIEHIDMVEYLPPGLYEMIIDETDKQRGLGDYRVRFEERGFEDIMVLDDGFEDEAFAAANTASRINDQLYRTFISPFLKSMINELAAEFLRQLHPLRVQRYALSDLNPLLWFFAAAAPLVKGKRIAVSAANPFREMEKCASELVVGMLDYYKNQRDLAQELIFKALYDQPWMKMVNPRPAARLQAAEEIPKTVEKKAVPEISVKMKAGGFEAGAVRLAVLAITADRIIEDQEFELVKKIFRSHSRLKKIKVAELKRMVKEQSELIGTDLDQAISSLAALLPASPSRDRLIDLMKKVYAESGRLLKPEEKALLGRLEAVLGVVFSKR